MYKNFQLWLLKTHARTMHHFSCVLFLCFTSFSVSEVLHVHVKFYIKTILWFWEKILNYLIFYPLQIFYQIFLCWMSQAGNGLKKLAACYFHNVNTLHVLSYIVTESLDSSVTVPVSRHWFLMPQWDPYRVSTDHPA